MKKTFYFFLFLASSILIEAQESKDFTLFAATTAKSFKLSEVRGKYVALHFLLKTECPVCLRHTQQYAEQGKKLKNVIQVFIKPDETHQIKLWASHLSNQKNTPIPIYRDVNAQLAKSFNIPDGYAFHGQRVHYPCPNCVK